MNRPIQDRDARTHAVEARLREAEQTRRPWWRDAERRDADAEQRDGTSRGRDDDADARDAAAERRDTDAAIREQAAVDLTTTAHARLDAQDAADTDLTAAHAESVAALGRTFDQLRAVPGMPTEVLDSAQVVLEGHLARAYLALDAIGAERREVRDDLRDVAQHLGADTIDRLAAMQDRALAAGDRHAARNDREYARTDRQMAAVDRVDP
ncbi:hypothetical protein [Nostocoides japonicum]|nr:hypothetical protein [Tetrasphaera japonica]